MLLLIIFIGKTVCSQTNQTSDSINIFFDSGKSNVSLLELKKIKSIKNRYTPKEVVINLRGYADELGSNNYNLILSKKRVNAVKKLIKGYRILKKEGVGELKGISFKNRKVLIEVIKKEQKGNSFSNLKVGDEVVLKNVLFLPGTDSFDKSSIKSLTELYSFLKEKSKVRIKITGHICCPKTDNPKTDAYNSLTGVRNLSEARAEKVYKYLIRKGILKKRIKYEGMAYKKPLGKEDKYNRRVEIEIIK